MLLNILLFFNNILEDNFVSLEEKLSKILIYK